MVFCFSSPGQLQRGQLVFDSSEGVPLLTSTIVAVEQGTVDLIFLRFSVAPLAFFAAVVAFPHLLVFIFRHVFSFFSLT